MTEPNSSMPPGTMMSSHPLGGNPACKRGLTQRTPQSAIISMMAAGLMRVHLEWAAPASFGVAPTKLSMWLNDQFGDCVSAEEAFWIACMTFMVFGASKEEVIPDQAIKTFCNKFNVLNGADLQEVIQDMQSTGITDGSNNYKDGKYAAVDYTKPSNLTSAIAQYAVVKIAIDANALPSGAGNQSGWFAFGGRPGQFPNTDHCVALSGYGTAAYCFGLLGIAVPSGVDPNKPDCRLLFTWSTIGVVDDAWIMSTVVEAYGRDSLIINGTPIVPTPGPGPGPSPGPFTPPFTIWLDGNQIPLLSFSDQAQAITMAQLVSTTSPTSNVDVKDSAGKVVQHFGPPGPGPTPGPGLTITLSGGWKDGTYTVGGAPQGGAVLAQDTVALIKRDFGTGGGSAVVIPPFILNLLKFLCPLAPLIPAPFGTILTMLCSLIPHAAFDSTTAISVELPNKLLIAVAAAKKAGTLPPVDSTPQGQLTQWLTGLKEVDSAKGCC